MGAHYKNLTQLIGTEQTFGIRRIYFHQEYNSLAPYNYDVALIRLDRPAIIDKGQAVNILRNIGTFPGISFWGFILGPSNR